MKLLLLTIVIICSIQVLIFSQELKPKKSKILVYNEEYNILASDKKVKQGDYKKYRTDGSQTWAGKFNNNIKVGEWKYYEDGQLEQSYNYDEMKLTFQRKPTNVYFIQINNQIQLSDIDTPPAYLGSKIRLTEELNKVMNYSAQARRMGIEGPVRVGIWVNEDNTVGDIELISGIMKECNEELITSIKKIPGQWFAATKDGEKIKSKLIVTAEFKLDNIFEDAVVTVR